jgi:hypothetical protein
VYCFILQGRVDWIWGEGKKERRGMEMGTGAMTEKKKKGLRVSETTTDQKRITKRQNPKEQPPALC